MRTLNVYQSAQCFFLQGIWSYILKYETYSFIEPYNGLKGAGKQ